MSEKRLKFFVGVNTGYVTHGIPDGRFIDFYRRRASPELHCAIVGNVVVPNGYGTNTSTPMISKDAVWTSVSSAISERGSLPGIQLATTWKNYQGARKFLSPNADKTIAAAREIVEGLGPSGIAKVLESLNMATTLAINAGFRHLQIHAAHGYLFSLLVDQRFNARAQDVIAWLNDWVARQTAVQVETSIRISLRTGVSTFDAEGRDFFYESISNTYFDFVDVSSGFYNINKKLIYPSLPNTLLDRRNETIALSYRFPNKKFIYSGRALHYSTSKLPSNLHIGICRDLIANPDFLIYRNNGCVNSGKCHYFSQKKNNINCSQWEKYKN